MGRLLRSAPLVPVPSEPSVVTAAPVAVAASTATVAEEVDSGSVLEIADLTALVAAWNSGEIEAIRAFYSDNAAYVSDEQVIALQRKEPVSVLVADEAFVERVWAWKREYGGRITEQHRRLGVSVDWDRERFTLDEGLSRAVRTVFVRLYEEGLIYRTQRMVNWSPAIGTVLSDLEVEEKELKSHLWHIAYPVNGTDERLVVATTRPETMFGDTAVAVHPDDERYRHLIGRTVRLPLTDRDIPIIGDGIAVDPAFGTGALKITPGHDFSDFETGQRNDLPVISIMTPDAHLNDNVPPAYRGMERFDARKQVVADLEAYLNDLQEESGNIDMLQVITPDLQAGDLDRHHALDVQHTV